ncbi:hypothetical protein A4W72_01370 [Latilactobacillus curvatus]|nr:hypothetical protein A4W72_01370 [Latilactobacillus curvatus]
MITACSGIVLNDWLTCSCNLRFFLGGLVMWASHVFWGLLLSITIIGIPFGRQHFKLAALSLSPFGKQIN